MTHLTKFYAEPWDILFKNFFDTDSFFAPVENTRASYPVDIYESKEGNLAIDIAVPGLDSEDITITECDGLLQVSYNKEQKEDASYIQRSIAKRSFRLGWKISEKYDLKKIEVVMDKGILHIQLPKAEEKQIVHHKVPIKTKE